MCKRCGLHQNHVDHVVAEAGLSRTLTGVADVDVGGRIADEEEKLRAFIDECRRKYRKGKVVKLVVPASQAEFGLAREDVTEWRTFICEVETIGTGNCDVRSASDHLICVRLCLILLW